VNPIAAAVRRFVRDNFLFGQEPTFSDGDSFLDQGIVDSTGVLELVTFLEDEYQITIKDEELIPENLDSIDNVVRFVQLKRRAANLGDAAGSGLGSLLEESLATPGTPMNPMSDMPR